MRALAAVDANTILSGLFFDGNERRLLLASIRGGVTLVFGEDVVEEVYAVIERTFGDHPDMELALELLEVVLGLGMLVPRDDYASEMDRWAGRLKDPSDAHVVACAVSSRANYLVSGDEGILVLREVGDVKVCRTRDLLDILGLNAP